MIVFHGITVISQTVEPSTKLEIWTRLHSVVALLLFVVLAAEVFFSARQESQAFDESAHIYSGMSYWTHGDFGVNPEHPPLVKLVAALPLLPLHLRVDRAPDVFFRRASLLGGIGFLYANDAERILARSRIAVSIFVFLLALLILAAAREMFGAGAAIFALALFVFEPTILGHAPLVTTDIAASCGVFAAVYAFYRYCKQPSAMRILVWGVAAGLALAAKHSAVLILPIVVALAITEILARPSRLRQTARFAAALVIAGLISISILWAFYGFRYSARPGGEAMNPPAATFLASLGSTVGAKLIGFLESFHLLPESYLFGTTDIASLSTTGRTSFVLGKLYPGGLWFYFPVTFAIKVTLAMAALLLLGAVRWRRWNQFRRELLFMAVPALLWMGIAMTSKLNIGIRHVLPMYPFLIVLAGAAGWMLVRHSRRWAWVAAFLLILHAGSSLKAFPNYLSYSNEIWGGPRGAHRILNDANLAWSSGLKPLKRYLVSHNIQECWLAFNGPVDPGYYHIPCKPLPMTFAQTLRRSQGIVPVEIQGPVFLSATAVYRELWGAKEANPYRQFAALEPSIFIDGELLGFEGSFHIPEVSGVSHYVVADRLRQEKHPDEAIAEARDAVRLAPNLLPAHVLLAQLFAQKHLDEEANREYQEALRIYNTVNPEFQRMSPPPENPVKRVNNAAQ